MKVIRRSAAGRAIEIQLSDNETALKLRHDELVRNGESRYDAWRLLTRDPTVTQVQRNIIWRDTFQNFLVYNRVYT